METHLRLPPQVKASDLVTVEITEIPTTLLFSDPPNLA